MSTKQKLQKDIDETTSTFNKMLTKILSRNNNLKDLKDKSKSLEDVGKLFKKTVKSSEPPVVDNTKEEINDVDITEYTSTLKELLIEGEVDYVLEKAAQLGLFTFVEYIIDLSKIYPLKLNTSNALNNAAIYGHADIVEYLIFHDADTEFLLTTYKRLGIYEENHIELLDFLDIDVPPYMNQLLTMKDLETAINYAKEHNHEYIEDMINIYYQKTTFLKENFTQYVYYREPTFDLKTFLENDKILLDL